MKPYAWINVHDEYKILFDDELPLCYPQAWIPLYTHPAKTLTDGEYDNIFANGKRLGVLETEDKFRKAMNLTDEEIITVLTDKFVKDQGRYASTNLFYIEFARAILKKASEK